MALLRETKMMIDATQKEMDDIKKKTPPELIN